MMGGNLFKLGRLPKAEYLILEARLREYLDTRLGEHYRIPRYYKSKADFGDVDIVVSDAAFAQEGQSWETLREDITAALGITRYKSTGAVFSTVYSDFQVDYFVRPSRYFLSTYNFLCFNDLGNLLGKMFKRMNLKYGERGLQYVFRRGDDNYKRDIDISLDITRICTFLELDIAPWNTGFETLEEMYAWVVSSPWFSAQPYRDPRRTMRARAKSRPTIQRFMAWLDQHNIQQTVVYPPEEHWLERVEQAFPEAGLMAAIAAEEALAERMAAVRARFSGARVMALIPGLEGAALGAFIRSFQASFEDFPAEVSVMDPAEVERRVLAHWQGRSTH